MKIKYTPAELDDRLDDKGKPVPGIDGKIPDGPFLDQEFTGHIEIKVPSFPERLRFPKQLIDDEDDKAGGAKQKNLLEKVALCSELIKPFIVEVALKGNGREMKTADELYDDPDAGTLVMGLCTKFINGFLKKKP